MNSLHRLTGFDFLPLTQGLSSHFIANSSVRIEHPPQEDDYLRHIDKLDLLSASGIFTGEAETLYLLMGMDFAPTAFSDVIGLSSKLSGGVDYAREKYWDAIDLACRNNRSKISKYREQSRNHRVEIIDADFLAPDQYIENLNGRNLRVVLVKGLISSLRAANPHLSEHKAFEGSLNAFRELDKLLPKGAFIVIFETSPSFPLDTRFADLIKQELNYSDFTFHEMDSQNNVTSSTGPFEIIDKNRLLRKYTVLTDGRVSILKK